MKRTAVLRALLQQWLFRVRGPEPAPIRLGQRRIFVMPSGFGLALAATLLTMLLSSINYSLSLGFALTFLVGGVAWVSIHHAFRNLVGLSVSPARAAAVFCGEMASFGIMLDNPLTRPRRGLRLWPVGSAAPEDGFDIPAEGSCLCEVRVPSTRRGWLQLPRLTLETRHPIGLIRAWSLFQPELRCLIFPAPEADAPPLPVGSGDLPGASGRSQGRDDFSGLRAHQPSDSPRHVAWKALARSGIWLTKQFEGGGAHILWLDWHTLPSTLDGERRLSRLTRWVCEADASGGHYGLRLPGIELAPASGTAHRLACLGALALHGATDE